MEAFLKGTALKSYQVQTGPLNWNSARTRAIIQWCREARLAVTTVDRAFVAAVAAEVSRERKCVTDVMVNVSAWGAGGGSGMPRGLVKHDFWVCM